MEKTYLASQIESEVQRYWQTQQTFEVSEDTNKEKFYCLSMLPYPSGKLHMGHVRNYTLGDVIARYQRMLGKNVLHPIGWDAFGLPAENAAIKNNSSPATWTYENIDAMRIQFKSLGMSFDWSRELATCDPNYYRWEQWFFIQLFKKGLIYRKDSVVNWDPVDQTVLANEQVVDGKGWRSGAVVEKKSIPQWFVKITDYADELLEELDTLTGWPEQVKTMQRNWIGRSEGVAIKFPIKGDSETLEVFTTRADTLYGATYLAISPEHPLVQKCAENDADIAAFVKACKQHSTMEADLATAEKIGIDTGLRVIHPLTGAPLPVWGANFVLMEYGSGAVMSVPGHDPRDHEFAKKYQLPIQQVVCSKDQAKWDINQAAFEEYGVVMNSGQYDGLSSHQAKDAITQLLIEQGIGKKEVNYRLRDWGVSRQRYWGTPIPIIYCDHCGAVPVPESDLPVTLPDDVSFDGEGSPLSWHEGFQNVTCPSCGKPARRETDTLDTFFESSWYYLRYTCPDQNQAMLDERARYWENADQYVGGIEHAVMHLLYARFFHKLMRDEGLIQTNEPFVRLLTQGMVLKDGSKMSKSKGNVVDPQALIDQFGADTVRLFSIFAAPPEQSLEWSDSGVEGAHRFLKKLWQHATLIAEQANNETQDSTAQNGQKLRRDIHQLLKQASADMERQQFNTIVSAGMKMLNTLSTKENLRYTEIQIEGLSILVRILSPIAPHICQAIWQALKLGDTIVDAEWPSVDESALQSDEMTLIVQVNGKKRGEMVASKQMDQTAIERQALDLDSVKSHVEGATIHKIIYVPNRLINIVAR